MLSIFTPTHDFTHLARLANSLIAQIDPPEYEWVVVPNGKSLNDTIGVQGQQIPNLNVVRYTSPTDSIGAIKNFADSQCVGDFLLEVDHDDELAPNALAEIQKAIDANPNADFIYSNCCEIKDGKPFTYSDQFGWKYRPFDWQGTPQLEQLCFDPGPASFGRIWYAPNHIRCWKRSFYQRIGGHDPSRDVLDDQDLMCRTYIEGNVHHIDQCLYIYHVHNGNTNKGDKNARIQTETLELHDCYIYRLCEKWADLNDLRKLDLCGGISPVEGYESVDLVGGDIQADLNERWPFEDGSVGVLRAHDAIEHLHDPMHTMKEAYRVLAPGGWFLTQTPSTDGRGAFQDPTHVSFWNSNSFWYYTNKDVNKYIDCPVRFQAARLKNFFPNEFCKTHNIVYVKADLMKVANQRVPGLVQI